MDVDIGYHELLKIYKRYGNKSFVPSNEAETRKLIIDEVLEKVLGWEPGEDIKYEERVSEDGKTTFADYSINIATANIVVEAKRYGEAFSLPINKKAGILGGVLSEGAVGDAIKQARDYARKLSIEYAVVTNGNSWIIFPAIRTDRVTFEETRATIFKSLRDVKERFVEFWEHLSRQRVIEGGLESSFFGRDKSLISRRLILTFKEPGYRLGRNTIYEYIEPAVNAALTDESLLENIEALSKCYVKNAERVKFDSRIKMYLADIKPQLERTVTRVKRGGDPKKLDKQVTNYGGSRPQFILILGPVGAGKTTFLTYTREISAKSSIDNKIVWLNMDFKKATESDEPKEFIYKELLRLIEDDKSFNLGLWEHSILPAYSDFIDARKRGTLAPIYRSNKKEFERLISESIDKERQDGQPFVDKILSYTSKKLPIYLIIDNVDQYESNEYQRKVFSEAQALARRINSHVILSLRDATYIKHRTSPVFDAFQVDTLYIDPPQVRPVLSRRFVYAKRELSGKEAEISSESGLRLKVKDLSIFFEIVSKSVLSEKAGYMIEVLSGNDIRRGLDLVREFLASGHTSADNALNTYMTKGSYQFPDHEIFKGSIFGQRKYFREEESMLLNILDSKLGTIDVHLLRLHILLYLVRCASEATYEGTNVEDIKEDLHSLGISDIDIIRVLNDLYEYKAIRSVDGISIHEKSIIYPTRLGGFLINDLVHRFMYFEPCCIDSSIYDDETWEKLKSVNTLIESANWREAIDYRIDRAKIFMLYIENIERKWVVNCKRRKLSRCWADEYIRNTISPEITKDFERVKASADRTQAAKDEKK